jgi:hypothetical protein
MRKSVVSVLLVLPIFFAGCRKNDLLPVDSDAQAACFESRPVVHTANQFTGTVYYRTDLAMYVIRRAVPGTYDSVWLGVVCNLPDAYRVDGKRVEFSGEYRNAADLPRITTFAGEETYYLFLSSIR